MRNLKNDSDTFWQSMIQNYYEYLTINWGPHISSFFNGWDFFFVSSSNFFFLSNTGVGQIWVATSQLKDTAYAFEIGLEFS